MTLLQPIALDSAAGSQRPGANMLRLCLGALTGATPNPGVVGTASLAVSQHAAGANMSVDIAGGPLFAKQSEGPQQGLFFSFNDAVINAVIGAADPTNPRIDVVIATFRDSSISGANNDAIIAVVPGTPAGAPVQPNPTTAGYKNYIQLAAVRVDALVTTIVNAKITDLRTMSGTQMAVISATTQYTATPTKGNAVYRATGDVAEGPEFYNGAAWRKPWSMPWGNIGVGSATAIQTPIAALTDLTNLTVSFTAVANRRIQAMIFVKLQQ